MQLQSLRCRDPFLVRTEGKWYLFRSHDGQQPEDREGVDVFCSRDGREWSFCGPALSLPAAGNTYWAPEVHRFREKWYLFVTVTGLRPGCGITTPLGKEMIRGTCVFRADQAEGPYLPWSDGPVTPWEHLALDGTLYVAPNGSPWMIYCHEWLQTTDGTIEAVPLTPDLKAGEAAPAVLFKASDAPWCKGQYVEEACGIRFGSTVRVTDGPFAFHDLSGALCLLWSTGNEGLYQTGLARSPSGKLTGPWEHARAPLYANDGGHAMLLPAEDGACLLALHQPNRGPFERARLLPARITDTGLELSADAQT